MDGVDAMTNTEKIAWIAAGLLAWFALHYAFPRAAALVLVAFVVMAIIKLGPQLANVGK
jgi:hypothetical protein